MGNRLNLKCPGSDPISKAKPEQFSCTDCGADVEIWTDEKMGKCSICNKIIYKDKIEEISSY